MTDDTNQDLLMEEKQSGLTMSEYQKRTLDTATKGSDLEGFTERDLARFCLGISDEAGEVAGALKKYLRRDFDVDELRRRVLGELGDVMWYIAVFSYMLNLDLESVAEANLEKLQSRKDRGKIKGDGDNR